MSTATENKPVKIGQLPIVKDNILKNAREMDKGIAGGYSGAFPLSSATKDGIYLVPQTGKFYVCETAYDGNQITLPNSNFVELSLWKNHNSLTNLSKIKSHISLSIDSDTTGEEAAFTYERKKYNDTFNIKETGLYLIIATISNINTNEGYIELFKNSSLGSTGNTQEYTTATVSGCFYMNAGETITVKRYGSLYNNAKCQPTILIKIQ